MQWITDAMIEQAVSPCIGICQLDPAQVCVGCYRSGQEIAEWSACSNHRKREILLQARERSEHIPD